MNIVTLEALNEKLKNAPISILEKIWGYADALLENKEFTFTLTDKQKKHLLNQNDVPLEQCKDAEVVYQELKKKYDL